MELRAVRLVGIERGKVSWDPVRYGKLGFER